MVAPTFVHDYLRHSAWCYPEKTALIFENQRITYRELDMASDRIGAALIDYGIARQDRIVIFLDNCPEIIVSLYGILKANAVFVIVNGGIKANKLLFILKDSGAGTLITHTNKADVVKDACKKLDREISIIWQGDSGKIPEPLNASSVLWDSIFKATDPKIPIPSSRIIDLDLTALIYTSGSTGEPKGVMVTHYNMISAAKSIIQHLGNTKEDVILDVLPLSFNYGLYQVIMSVMFGGTVVIERSFTYIHKVLQHFSENQITGFPIVPTILAMILKFTDLNRYNLDSLRYITNTGAKLSVSHIQQFRSLFPHVRIHSMFGLTECKRVCSLPPEEIDYRPESVGKPMPNCEVFLIGDDGNEVEPGQIGELVVRGANVMRGYWNAPELTGRVFRPGRFPGEVLLWSGDYFKTDEEGFLYFVGRKDDIIKSKGERLNLKEIEDILCEMDGVAESAIIGVPDEINGLVLKAFIVCEKTVSLEIKDIMQHCRKHLEPYAIPRSVLLIDCLPKTDHGKTDKKSLKNWNAEGIAKPAAMSM